MYRRLPRRHRALRSTRHRHGIQAPRNLSHGSPPFQALRPHPQALLPPLRHRPAGARDGAAIEELGWYDPTQADPEKQTSLQLDRIRHWIGTGAQPSETVSDMLVKHGVLDKDTRKLVKG